MPLIIGAIMAALSRLIASRVGMWAIQLLLFLGIGFATNALVIEPTIDEIKSAASGSGEAVVWLAMAKFDIAITMVASAWITRISAQSLRAFLVRRS